MVLPAWQRLAPVGSRVSPPERLPPAEELQRAVWLQGSGLKQMAWRARARWGRAGCALLWRPLPWPGIELSRRIPRETGL